MVVWINPLSFKEVIELLRNSSETGDCSELCRVAAAAEQLLNVATVTDLDGIKRHHIGICEVLESDVYTRRVVSYSRKR